MEQKAKTQQQLRDQFNEDIKALEPYLPKWLNEQYLEIAFRISHLDIQQQCNIFARLNDYIRIFADQ